MNETELLRKVEQLCWRNDVWWYHPEMSLRDRRGMPDLVLAGTRGAAVRELKSATGKLSPEQQTVSQRIMAAGWDFAIWRPADLASGRIEHELAALSERQAVDGVGVIARPTERQLRKLHAGFYELGYRTRSDRSDRLMCAAEALSLPRLDSFNDLTKGQAGYLLGCLRRGELAVEYSTEELPIVHADDEDGISEKLLNVHAVARLIADLAAAVVLISMVHQLRNHSKARSGFVRSPAAA